MFRRVFCITWLSVINFTTFVSLFAMKNLNLTLCPLAEYFRVCTKSCIMSVKLTYGYSTTIDWFQYFLVFNLYRRMNKFEYISENSHIVVSESCLHYLTIDNWFHNFRLFDLQWTIWMYLLMYNLFSKQWFKELIDSTEKTSILALFYTFVESFILRILLPFVESA